MPSTPPIDLRLAHKYFAAECFNRAWDLIEKPDRTPADDRLMEALTQASLFHWLQRPDCADKNLSIGYWQASRVQALLERGAEALRHARTCLEHSRALPPFYRGYAYEALARAAEVAGRREDARTYLAQAREQAAKVADADSKQALLKDLETLAR
ncbi:MAG: hypothetical protein M5U26_10140 [Planctomycetota bacterium]|nr:hypothetical protein [Planctomycetota bacterium]